MAVERYQIKDSFRDAFTVRGVALIASFTALVFLSTLVFSFALASSGFFNLGEAFIYIAALVGGPLVGGISGGLGASMADLALGYGLFAPGTAVIKFAEGFVAGYLYKMSKKVDKRIKYGIIGIFSAFLIGFSAYFANKRIEGGFILNFLNQFELNYGFPGYVLLIVACVLCAILWFVVIKFGDKGEMAISCSLAGIIIIVGYFLYEISMPFLNIPVGAAASEIPFNIAQVLFGVAIAVPVVSYLRSLGVLRDENDDEEERVDQKDIDSIS